MVLQLGGANDVLGGRVYLSLFGPDRRKLCLALSGFESTKMF